MRMLILLATLGLALGNLQIASGQEKIRIVGSPTMRVETSCNANGDATTPMALRNEGSTTALLRLSASDLSSKSPAKHLFVFPTLAPNNASLDSKQELTVQATVTKLYEDGEWESAIQNDGVDVGILRIVRVAPPFSLSLDAPKPDEPELTFVKGRPAHFRLINADPEEYTIGWEYSVNGHIVRSTGSDSPPKPARPAWYCRWFCGDDGNNKAAHAAGSPSTISAGGQKEIVFMPPLEWFGGGFTGLFKDDTVDGRLTVSLIPPNCATDPPISKTFKVKTHLATSSGPWREGWADAWVFFFLALGGLFSLGLNSLLPNQARRTKAKEQLSKLGAQISNLSFALASRLRVLVGQQHRLISDRLKDLTWTSTDFAGEMQNIEQAMVRLATRLQFLDGLGTTRTNFLRLQADVLPPSVNFAMEQTFEKIVEIGEKSAPSDEDVQVAQALIKRIQDQLDCGVQGNADFAKTLGEQAAKFKSEFDPTNGRIGKTATCQRIRTVLPGPFDHLDAADPATIKATAAEDASSVQDYIDLDERLFELDIIREYVDLVEGMSATDSLRAKIATHEPELLDRLKLPNYDAMYGARLLIRQMKDAYFKDDIENEVTAKRVRIRVDHDEVRQYEPCEFRLEFLKSALNAAYARQEWTCRWSFTLRDDARTQVLTEEGWCVTHYFQQGTAYELKITLTHEGDATVLDVPNLEVFPEGKINVIQQERRYFGRAVKALLRGNWGWAKKEWKGRKRTGKALDYLRLAMALVIALFSLIAGAKEQLLKLDVLPALLAVFLVGFGADQIKNLLTQKSPGMEASTNTSR